MEGAGKALKSDVGEAERIVIHLRDATKAQTELSRITESHARGFDNLGRAGKSAWQAIGGAADASITKIGSGLSDVLSMLGPIGIGVGTVFGVALAGVTAAKAIADAAVTRQRSAFGVGVTPGQQSSFGVYGQQFLGQNALQTAANVQSNFGNAGALGALGIDFNQARSWSKSHLAFEMLRQGVRIANASPDLPFGNNPLLAQYAALTGDADFDQLRNAMAMGSGALDKAESNVNRNAASMNFGKGEAANAALLKMAAEGAGVRAQTWLINNTTGIDPVIAKGLDALSGDPRKALATLGDTIRQKVVPPLEHFVHTLNLASGGLLHNMKSNATTAIALHDAAYGSRNPFGSLMIDPLAVMGNLGDFWNWATGTKPRGSGSIHALGGSSPRNNPLNMKIISGGNLLWGQYGSVDEGIRANAARLLEYKSDWGADTLASLIPIWNGHGANSADYINNVEKWSGVSRFARLHSLSQSQFAAVESAMSREEGTSPVSRQQVMNALFRQQQRPTTILVQVSNPTQSRVSVSVKGANP